MKRMIALCLLLLFLAAAWTPHSARTARAEEDAGQTQQLYAVAAERGVWLYSEADERTGLFILPYTYYVRVIAPGDPFCYVEYMDDSPSSPKVSGYCKKDELTFVDFIPERPYLKQEITVVYSLPDAPSVSVGDDFFYSTEITYLYYGDYTIGSAAYYYVCLDGKFGYIPAVQEIEYDLNTDYLSQTNGNAVQPQPDTDSPALSGIQIFLLCAACASVVAVSAFVLRGKRAAVPPRDDAEF